MYYNITRDYDWTSIPRGSSLREEAPSVYLKSYKIISNQIYRSIIGYMNLGKTGFSKQGAKEFYENLYGNGATSQEDDFVFPFFDDNVRSFSNNFSDTFQSGVGGGNAVMGDINEAFKGWVGSVGEVSAVVGAEEINKAFTTGDTSQLSKGFLTGGDAGTYIETPMFYQYEKNDSPLNVSFFLSNTINQDSVDKNYNFIKYFTSINRAKRLTSIAVEPPRIYSVKVPGHRFIRWAVCSNFSVSFIGSRRTINDKIIPEGYKIDLSFQSLTLEHSGFMEDV